MSIHTFRKKYLLRKVKLNKLMIKDSKRTFPREDGICEHFSWEVLQTHIAILFRNTWQITQTKDFFLWDLPCSLAGIAMLPQHKLRRKTFANAISPANIHSITLPLKIVMLAPIF